MPRREDEEIERVHVTIYSSDAARLRELYGEGIGISKAVRKMIRAALKKIGERQAQAYRHVEPEPGSVKELENGTER